MRVPVILTCECGRTISADAGDEVRCECGRRYATELSAQQLTALNAMQAQMRVFARLGTGLVGLMAVVGFFTLGRLGGLAFLVAGIVGWWVLLQPVWRRHLTSKLAALPPADARPL